MRVLWFEVTVPAKYRQSTAVLGGWQDSLEAIVKSHDDMELYIAFDTNDPNSKPKCIENVNYIPIVNSISFFDRLESLWTSRPMCNRVVNQAQRVVNQVKPDIIHVFGTEWPYGLVAKYAKCPVVLHIQGALVPYNNALFPPNYNLRSVIKTVSPFNLRRKLGLRLSSYKSKSNEEIECQVWKTVNYYMGRTEWDKRLSNIMHPGRSYFHVDEALRDIFINKSCIWQMPEDSRVTLVSTGCGTFWKGPDMLLKTAHILTKSGLNFEWRVAGVMPEYLKDAVERKEKLSFADNNVVFVGQLQSDELAVLLCSSTLYIHTAYIENSPNSLCEAQYLGVPIVSTNVGGIASLVDNNSEGYLVPANDPWQMASTIVELSMNKELMTMFSENGRRRARQRHNKDQIYSQLINCYQSAIQSFK